MPEGVDGGAKLIVALDVETMDEARRIVDTLASTVKIFKVGLGLFTAYGPDAVEMVHKKGAKVFLDLKFHDIPSTVACAVKSAAKLGVFMVNLHSLGGADMIKRAVEAMGSSKDRPKLLGVTILTSMDQTAIGEIGISAKVEDEVLNLAKIARDNGLDGVVASPKETALIRKTLGDDFIIVTPGIRPSWSGKGDQKRIMTPKEAIEAGADYIVVGRPILEAREPLDAAKKVIEEIEG